MSDEVLGTGHNALSPRESPAPRHLDHSSVRLAQVVGGQYVLTSQPHMVSALAQINNSNVSSTSSSPSSVTRIISLSPSRVNTGSIRPSLANQTIVSALTKSRPNVRLQLFPNDEQQSTASNSAGRIAIKRSLSSTPERKDTYASKLQRVMNHRNVRSKIVKEKYNEHLLEKYYLENEGNILDLHQFAKRPKSQHFLLYFKEHSIDPADASSESLNTSSANGESRMQSLPSVTVSSPTPPCQTQAVVQTTPPLVDSIQQNCITEVPVNICTSTPEPSNNTSTSTNKSKSHVSYPSNSNQEQIVEKAKQEAYVVQRINDLQREGLWSEKKLPKVQEMPRPKAHWDFLLEEMVWLAADFAQERKWKKAAAKKCARMVQKHFQDKALAAQRAEKAHEQHLRRVAAFCAKEIKNFWSNIEKVVEYKQNTRLEEKRKKALDQHLSFIVDQTEKYSQLLAEGMNKSGAITAAPSGDISVASSNATSRVPSDDEFKPDDQDSTDDEETIAQEEAATDQDQNQSEEVAALQRESEMDLETFLKELPKDYLENRDNVRISESESESDSDSDSRTKEIEVKEEKKALKSRSKKRKDEDFSPDSSSAEDDEGTIQEQEEAEGIQDHHEELEALKAESELNIEELRKKYSNLPPLPDEDSNTSVRSEDETDNEVEEGDIESSYSECESSEEGEISTEDDNLDSEIGLKSLLNDSSSPSESDLKTGENDLINDAAAIAESIQPKGNTLSSTNVVTPIPFLLKYPLREYQHIGLDWLVTMYERKLNGILADEMGLGKTIQTIALLAHLACEKGNWGPHLIVVPTSVMLNWEMECKKWCPAFKILTYYGTQKERKQKRMGWTKPNAFHICITSYKLVIQDHQSFRRKKWKYLILDEAQNIKNFKSQRWQLLLNFTTQQRLLLTGTPLQNNLMELWSLMHFLMPHVFQSHREFKEWFSNPVTGMIEGNSEYNESIIKRLHKVLRPFLLRRLKSEVEKQMPKKYEHVIMCRLSKRQRFLYDDYMSRANAYQCYRARQYRTPRRLIEEVDTLEEPPCCPPAKLMLSVHKLKDHKSATTIKQEPKETGSPKVLSTAANSPIKIVQQQVSMPMSPNVKLIKTPSQSVALQFVQHQGNVKAIPVVSQTSQMQASATVNLSSVLKSSEKITLPQTFAQLVQTSTGKHILLTPTTNVSSTNIAISGSAVTSPGGQRLTVLSKQPVSTGQVVSGSKGIVKLQLGSVTNTPNCNSNVPQPTESKTEDNKKAKKVGSRFIERLYGSQSNNLDVRWKAQKLLPPSRNQSFEERDLEITDYQKNKVDLIHRINERRCSAVPLYGKDFHDSVKIYSFKNEMPWISGRLHCLNALYNTDQSKSTNCLNDLLYTPERRIEQLKDIFDRFVFYVPSVHAPEPELRVWHLPPSTYWGRKRDIQILTRYFSKPATPLHPLASAMVTQFPDPRLIQYDCGKLQTLDLLLRRLKTEGHRVLIFTQMTKMLDVLEAFLNFHGHIYLRLDGSTKIDQRQVLMERFNGDPRIFAFILSTRSGGIGVNLTGADTVIFYDSDWNPTMDAQAQDRCHRIGQTRDVHIYRLVSERTIEENILKKANQKRLLGDLAIEGGNFTTAYFKSSTIQDLFNIDANEESAANRMSEVIECSIEREKYRTEESSITGINPQLEDKNAVGALENALAACEDDQDVAAARTAKAEAVADLAEFDENIPIDEQDKEKEPEISKAEQEVENLIKQLTPIERYAMRFIEETETAWSAEKLAAAEREIEEQKREWEENRLAALKEEEERRARELEEENEMLTYSREDATNQIWVSDNTMEQMPMWCPPTPPQQDTDVYIDHTISFLYETNVMSESQLPPVYVKKEAKRSRHEAGLIESRRALKIQRKDDSVYAPRSLFERPSPALVKMRRDLKLQKYRGIVRPLVPIPGMKLAISKPTADPPCLHNWTIHEDMALLKAVQSFQGLPLNLMIISPGHTPNWDFVADYVNSASITYRSPKHCRHRYETVIIPREEGKQIFDSAARKKKNKAGLYKFPTQKTNRPMRTSQLYAQDNNTTFSQIMVQRYEALKNMSSKRAPTTKIVINNPLLKNPKHTAVLNECGIDLDHPVLPVEVAARRAERIAREKKTMSAEQQLAVAQRLQLLKSGQITGNQLVQATSQTAGQSASPSTSITTVSVPASQSQTTLQTSSVVTTMTTTVITTPSTPPGALRAQRIVASPIQNPTVVSVSGLSPAQIQATTQRLIVSGTPGQAKAVVGGTATMAGKTISQAQLQMIRQATIKQQQLRLQAGGIGTQAVKTSTVTIAGQTAVQVQFTQAQPRTQFVKQGTVTVAGKQGVARTMTESEMAAHLLKRQHQLQQKVLATGTVASVSQTTNTTIQSLSPQVFAQAIQQAGTSGTQVATLVKTVSSSGTGTQTVTIPVSAVTIAGTPVKAAIAPGVKTSTPQQLRHLQIQQQLLTQKKLVNQKIAGIAQVTGKGGVATQLIVGSKPLSTAMTLQQFQQVVRSPLTVPQGPVVLAKGSPRVIPVNTAQGTKQTIQVVAATSQGLTTAIRPQTSSTLAGALTGIKVQGTANSQAQQAFLSQVSAALQNQNVGVRQSSPVRIQTSSGTPLVAVSVQSANVQASTTSQSSVGDRNEQA